MKKIKINWKSVVEEVSCFILASITAYIVEEYIWGNSFIGNISVFIVSLLIFKGFFALIFNNKQKMKKQNFLVLLASTMLVAMTKY